MLRAVLRHAVRALPEAALYAAAFLMLDVLLGEVGGLAHEAVRLSIATGVCAVVLALFRASLDEGEGMTDRR